MPHKKTLHLSRFFRNAILFLSVLLAACGSRVTPSLATSTLTAEPSPIPTATEVPAPLAARVNGEGIWLAEYDAALQQIGEAQNLLVSPLSAGEQQRLVMDALIDEALLAQAAGQAGFRAEENLQSVLGALKQAVGDSSTLDAWISYNGYTHDSFEHSLLRTTAAYWQREQLLSQTPTEVEQVRVRQILLPDESAAQEALALAQQPGADFTTLAFQYDPYIGGDLGWFPRGYLLYGEVEEAAFKLQPGEISPIIKSELGYHLLYGIDRQTRPLSFDAKRALQHRALSDWLDAQRTASKIEILVDLPTTEPTPTQSVEAFTPAVYAVQEGDNFYSIAIKFGVTIDNLTGANPSVSPELLAVGNELTIPGLYAPGRVISVPVQPGTNLTSIALAHGLPVEQLARLNRLTSPAELITGSGLVLPEEIQETTHQRLIPLMDGETILERAVSMNLSPWALALSSGKLAPLSLLTGDPLYLPNQATAEAHTAAIPEVTVSPRALVQGRTAVIKVAAPATTTISGWFDGSPLHFFHNGSEWLALQGVHAMAESCMAVLSLSIQPEAEATFQFEESLPVYSGDFPQDPPLTVDPTTIDPAVTQPEEEQILTLVANATSERYWQGVFLPPVDTPGCTRSRFGNRRSFNGSPFIYYHAGLDYGVCGSADIYAPAAGTVIYAGALDVRGNATIIDHGWGVYSGFWHQDEILVKVGDKVEPGQLVGKIGATGRVTGEHLHWELFVNGIQVDPEEWLSVNFP